jgi:hypothetical protein
MIEGEVDLRLASYSAYLDESRMDLIKDEEDDDASLFADKNHIHPKLEKANDHAVVKPEAPDLR